MTSNLRKGLLQFIFSGAYMKRWNDKLRPMELIEIDKQAHKMIVAWMLCQLNAQGMSDQDRLALEEQIVEGGLFEYIFRLIITDIKPPILARIKDNHEHYQKLAEWGIREIEPHLHPLDANLWNRFSGHILQGKKHGMATEVLDAAHIYSSVWEFNLLKQINSPFDDELAEVSRRFDQQLDSYRHIKGMDELIIGLERLTCTQSGKEPRPISAMARIANLCGQLRFQKRWSQTPRTPETSVMGHMFLVACYAFFLSITFGACPARRINSFFCGLFHDLPELLTRDIISPVKKSFSGLGEIIKNYEEQELERRFIGPLNEEGYGCITSRLGYYLGLASGSEFDDTVRLDGQVQKVDFDSLQGKYNKNSFDPKDGAAVKVCDILAAYIEAYTAMRNGITSDHIQQAFWRMREQNAKLTLGSLHVGALFTDFD